MSIDYAGSFACGNVVAWLIVFIWFPRSKRTTQARICHLSLSVVSTIAVLTTCWSFAGLKGSLIAALGLVVGASISFRLRQDINRTYREEIRECK